MAKKFSPPYGDGTKKFEIELGIHQFSPPYGAASLYHGGGQIEIPFQGEP